MNNRKDVIENIKKFGNAKSNYFPFDGAISYPLESMDFVRTGFLEISPTLSARDYKDPKIVIERKGKEKMNDEILTNVVGMIDDPHRMDLANRVYGTVSPTIPASDMELYRIESEYRIRKLTPKECFRLMGVTDEDADKMMSVNSNTQCYKQAGNSIVVDVMCEMFKRLF